MKNRHLAAAMSGIFWIVVFLFLPFHGFASDKPESHQLGKLAYVQHRDIWVKNLPDGEAKRLTTGGINLSPRWSPSGQWLMFRKRDLWSIRSDGKDAHELGGRCAWAPSADRLACVKNDRELWVVNADGTGSKLLGKRLSDKETMRGFAWSPDGASIVYNTFDDIRDQQPFSQRFLKVSSDGNAHDEICEVRSVMDEKSGMWSPGGVILAGSDFSGNHILFWQSSSLSASLLSDGASLYVVSAAGGKPRELCSCMLAYSDFVHFSPDKKRLAVSEGCGRETWSAKSIAVIDLTSGKRTRLTGKKEAAIWPAWSPDGRRIAYTASPEMGEIQNGQGVLPRLFGRRIWVMNSDGTKKRRLVNDRTYRDERPLWSADGSHLMFVRMNRKNQASLWLMTAEGRKLKQVVNELSGKSGESDGWHGYYGEVEWNEYFDWWNR